MPRNKNERPVKKARIEDELIFSVIRERQMENRFDFDGATTLDEIQENYNDMKEQLRAFASASDFSSELDRVTDVAQLALDKLDSWSVADIKAYIRSLCSANSIDHRGKTKEELQRLLTRFWLCNPERMRDYRAMMR